MSDASRRGKRNRRHGNDSELMVAAWLRENGWPDACTTRSLSRGVQNRAGDIHGGPCVIEVKAVTASRWPSWCRQAEAEAEGQPWLVVRREPGNIDVGTWPSLCHECAPTGLRTHQFQWHLFVSQVGR